MPSACLNKHIAAQFLDCVKAATALHNQSEVTAQDIAAGLAAAHRQRRVDLDDHMASSSSVLS